MEGKQHIALVISAIHNIPNKAVYQRPKMLSEKYNLHIFTKNDIPLNVCPGAVSIRRCPGSKLGIDSIIFPFWVLLNILNSKELRIVHTVFSFNCIILLTGFLCGLFGRVWIADILDDPALCLESQTGGFTGTFRSLAYRFLYLAVRKTLKYADSIIILKGMKEVLSNFDLDNKKIFEITNGVDLSRMKDVIAELSSAQSASNTFMILYVGIIKIERGLTTVVEATNNIKDKIPNLRVVLAGWHTDGTDMEILGQKIKDYELEEIIHFTGGLEHRDVLKLILQADICLYPFPSSRQLDHVSPIKVFEYMAFGKPVVASNLPGVQSIITHRFNGILVPPSDSLSLSQALLEIYVNEELKDDLTKNSQLSARDYDWNVINETIADHFESVVATCRDY